MGVAATPWKNVPEDITHYAGFVYLITNVVTGVKYVGRKYFWKETRVKVSGSTRRKKVTKESDWRYYKSSSKKVQEDVLALGADCFSFEILGCYESRAQVNEREVREQFVRDVLHSKLANGGYEYYNENILSRYFRPAEEGSPQYAARCAAISKSVETRKSSGKFVHPMQGKVHPNKGKKLPQTKPKTSIKGWRCWTDGSVVVKLPPEALPPKGFYLGSLPHRNKREAKKEAEYTKHPAECKHCSNSISYKAHQAHSIFCSRACANRGKTRARLTGTDNPRHKWVYHTPKGLFYSAKIAGKELGCSDVTVRNRCKAGMPGYAIELVDKKEVVE